MGVGLKIKAHLKNRGILVKDFATAIDENRTQVSDYLNEKLKPSVKFLEKTIDFFPELDLNYLFRDVQEVNEPGDVYEKPPEQLVNEIETKAAEIAARAEELRRRLSQK